MSREAVAESRQWLQENRPAFERARAFLEGPEGAQAKLDVLARLRTLLTAPLVRPAEFTLGQAREAIRVLEGPEEIVADFKNRQKSFARLEDGVAAEGDSSPHPLDL